MERCAKVLGCLAIAATSCGEESSRSESADPEGSREPPGVEAKAEPEQPDEDASELPQSVADALPEPELRGREPPTLPEGAEDATPALTLTIHPDRWAKAHAAARGALDPAGWRAVEHVEREVLPWVMRALSMAVRPDDLEEVSVRISEHIDRTRPIVVHAYRPLAPRWPTGLAAVRASDPGVELAMAHDVHWPTRDPAALAEALDAALGEMWPPRPETLSGRPGRARGAGPVVAILLEESDAVRLVAVRSSGETPSSSAVEAALHHTAPSRPGSAATVAAELPDVVAASRFDLEVWRYVELWMRAGLISLSESNPALDFGNILLADGTTTPVGAEFTDWSVAVLPPSSGALRLRLVGATTGRGSGLLTATTVEGAPWRVAAPGTYAELFVGADLALLARPPTHSHRDPKDPVPPWGNHESSFSAPDFASRPLSLLAEHLVREPLGGTVVDTGSGFHMVVHDTRTRSLTLGFESVETALGPLRTKAAREREFRLAEAKQGSAVMVAVGQQTDPSVVFDFAAPRSPAGLLGHARLSSRAVEELVAATVPPPLRGSLATAPPIRAWARRLDSDDVVIDLSTTTDPTEAAPPLPDLSRAERHPRPAGLSPEAEACLARAGIVMGRFLVHVVRSQPVAKWPASAVSEHAKLVTAWKCAATDPEGNRIAAEQRRFFVHELLGVVLAVGDYRSAHAILQRECEETSDADACDRMERAKALIGAAVPPPTFHGHTSERPIGVGVQLDGKNVTAGLRTVSSSGVDAGTRSERLRRLLGLAGALDQTRGAPLRSLDIRATPTTAYASVAEVLAVYVEHHEVHLQPAFRLTAGVVVRLPTAGADAEEDIVQVDLASAARRPMLFTGAKTLKVGPKGIEGGTSDIGASVILSVEAGVPWGEVVSALGTLTQGGSSRTPRILLLVR